MAKTFTVSRKSHYPPQKPHCKVEWYNYLFGATSFKDLQILSKSNLHERTVKCQADTVISCIGQTIWLYISLIMIVLYNSFVLPHSEYRCPLLLGVGKVQASRLEDANFYILRSVLGYGKTISYQELLGIVIMKTLKHKRICSSLLLPYKSLPCNEPYIRDFFNLNDSTYNSSDSGVNLSMPRLNLNWMKNSLTYQAAKIWNSLEPEVRKWNLFKFATSIKNKSFQFHFFFYLVY